MNESRTPHDAHDGARDGDEAVRRAYRELGDEPVPPMLDARVLDAARAAVRPVRTRPAWIVPAALAATVLIAVGVSLDVKRESGRDAQDYAGAVPTTPNAARATVDDGATENPTAAAPPPAGAAAEPASPDTLQAPQRREAAPSPVARASAERAPKDDAFAAPHDARSNRHEEARPAPRAARPASTAPAAPAAPPPALVAPMPAAPPPALDAPVAAAPLAGASADDAARRLEDVAVTAAKSAAAAERARRADDAAAKREVAPAAAANGEAAAGAAPRRTPERWLEDIEALRRAGRTADAEAELARFRAAYPDYPRR